MFRLKAAIAGALVSVAVSGCSLIGAQDEPLWQAGKEYRLTVLHTNDHHGRFWSNRHGEYGMAARKTLIDGIRAEVAAQGGELLLLSGGY
ncbi:hypothetical protein [Aliamphritea spongicola]|nr:hypothetical protein [Aliamphritea spongicola]